MEYISTTNLAKQYSVEPATLFEDLKNAGWINRRSDKWVLTPIGSQRGGILKSHPKFGEFIAWPENIDLSSLGGAEVNWLNATAIGAHFGVSSQRINLILSELGWIYKHVTGWVLTKQGYRVGGRQCEHETSGAQFVLWSEDILKNRNLIGVFADEPTRESKEIVASVQQENVTKVNDSFREKFEAKHRTQDGHYVRSRGEVIIDNLLYQYSLVHAYERKLPVEEELYSDFYLPSGKVYIEYWGLENDPKYAERKKAKQAIYQKYDFNLIELSDKDISNLDDVLPKYLLKFGIKVY